MVGGVHAQAGRRGAGAVSLGWGVRGGVRARARGPLSSRPPRFWPRVQSVQKEPGQREPGAHPTPTPSFFSTHSKRQWSLPTKTPGFWRTPLSEARYETAHDPALKALRRRTIDDE